MAAVKDVLWKIRGGRRGAEDAEIFISVVSAISASFAFLPERPRTGLSGADLCSVILQTHRQPARAPVAGFGLEHAGADGAAGLAFALRLEIPRGHVIPVSPDGCGAAM